MAPALAIVAVVAGAVGGVLSSISKANALRSEAAARRVEGEQELLIAKRQLRQELGQQAVEAGGSGLLGASFAGVFESQAILDAELLGQIQQRTEFDVANLKRLASATMFIGITSAGQAAAQGIGEARGRRAAVESARRRAGAEAGVSQASRNVPSQSGLLNRKLKLKGSPFG